MKIAIVILCTNAYFPLGIRLVKQFDHHYKGTQEIHYYLVTDTDPAPCLPRVAHVHYQPAKHACWQDGTNAKFSSIVALANEPVDYIYYFDADTAVRRSFTEDWFLGDLVGGEHYNNRWPDLKPYERRPESKAYVPLDTDRPQTYYYGAFFGGKRDLVIDFCQKLIQNQAEDKKIHLEPVWNDESYINQYFHVNPPTLVVKTEKFAFDVSDKGGLGNTRNPALDIQENKQLLLQFSDYLIDMKDGKVIPPAGIAVPPMKTLDLSTIKTIILHNRTPVRRDHVQTVLGKTHLDYTLFPCITDSNKLVSGIKSWIHMISELLKRPVFEPVLFLEDDINITGEFTHTIEIPVDADGVYLGLSACYSSFVDRPSVSWINIGNNKLVQITDMLSLHALIVTSERWLRVLLKCMEDIVNNPTCYDIPVARTHKDHKIYGFKKPLFYQDAAVGGQQGPTKITLYDIYNKVIW